jgi:hypothetical protein
MTTKTFFTHPDQVDLTAVDNAGRLAYRVDQNIITSLEVSTDKDGMVTGYKSHQLLITASQVVYMVDGRKKLDKFSYDKNASLYTRIKPNTKGDYPVKDINNLSDLMNAIVNGNADLQGNDWFITIAKSYLYCKVNSDGSRQQLNLDYWLHNLASVSKLNRDTIVSKLNFSSDELLAITALDKQATNKTKEERKQSVSA